jgi:UDP-N-acetylmuramate--alanine ligase
VAEADESDRSFLKLSPILAVVTNLDREHMDCYRDMADVEQAFLTFIDKLPFYGAVTACVDNPLLAAILPRAQRRVFTYGVASEADYRLEFLSAVVGSFARFKVTTSLGPLGPFELHVPGRHNVLNATAAVAIAHQLGMDAEKIALGLSHFRGVDRRFQYRGKARGVTVVDDYGHHPTEIRATLAAARECGYRQIHVVFQPHRFSRTLDLMDKFVDAFADADTVIVLPIYAASEEPIPAGAIRAGFSHCGCRRRCPGQQRRPDPHSRRRQRQPVGSADPGGAGVELECFHSSCRVDFVVFPPISRRT